MTIPAGNPDAAKLEKESPEKLVAVGAIVEPP
jgi:hypothetical protein